MKRQDASTGEIVDEESLAEPDGQTDNRPMMQIKVYSPFQTFFDEPAESISGENATGPFDILPHHHNFISLLKPCELVIRGTRGKKEQRIRISGGLMHVKHDQVVVFLDV